MDAHLAFRGVGGPRLHLGVCGSVAAYRALDLVRQWQDAGVSVSATLTPSAQKFVTPLTFAALGAAPVYTAPFDDPQAPSPFAHLEPGQVAQALVIAPASAATIARLAQGQADELLACQALAFRGKAVIAPAMNPAMWSHPATQANIATLRERGCALALLFDFINGFHDAANSIATIVSTKVLTPFQAVLWAAFFNFVAFFIAKYIIGGFGIANTVSKTVVEEFITLPIILSGVIAAIAWNLITWWKGIPSSSSHTLIGGFAGAAIMASGFGAIQLNIILKIAAFIFLAPFIGMVVAFGFTILVLHICRRVQPHKAEVWFKKLQLVSSAMFSIGHGLNDSQKVMGIIAAAMIAAHSMGLGMGINSIADLPDWVAFACFTAISLGTMSGGWKIVKTMGTKITKVTPLEGVVAETAGAFTLYLTEILKIPVSTTHTITGAIIGVGATKRLSAVRWGVTKSLLVAWILTIPVSALLAAGIYMVVTFFLG